MEEPIKPVEVEATRYQTLPLVLKVIFLVLSSAGVLLAVFYHFFTIPGLILIDYAYYLLLFVTYCTCAFIILPARKKDKQVQWYDLMAAALTFGLAIYFYTNAWRMAEVGWQYPTQLNFILGCIFALLILEGARRSGGRFYLAICVIFGLYPLFAEYMPGMLYGLGYPLRVMVGISVFTSEGLLGIPAKVIGDILIGFLLLAGMLIASGAGRFFLNLALALLGRYRGGPAKVAVVSSGFFGSMSGSILSNVAATGSITIPIMKRTGYPAHYAGAIEACASTGGALMPPVMGAIAFVMCMVIDVEYRVVLIAAALPALLYYFGLLMQVDAYAARVGIRGLPRDELPSIRRTLRQGWPFITVLIFLLWGLLYMRWEAMAPYYASGLLFLLSFTSKETMMTPRRIVDTIRVVGRLLTQTMAIILPIGFIICGLIITGVSGSFTSGLVYAGGGNLWLILLMGIMACYLMGMAGMAIAAYIFLAVTLAPAIIEVANLNVLAVHLFIVYYAILSAITPPVAVGAFLGAAMAGAPAMKTGWTAMRLGVVIYFIPLFFVFNPALILQGPILESLYLFILCLIGIALIAAGMEGYLVKVGAPKWWARPFLVVAGLLIAYPEWKTTFIGAALAALVIAIIVMRKKVSAGKLVTSG